MTDFRALCAELLQELEHASTWDYQQTLKDQARAALAEPEPQPPKLIYRYSPVTIAECGGPCEQGPEYCDCGEIKGEPEPQGPTGRPLITPPPELVQRWLCSDDYQWGPLEQTSITITTNRLQNVATQAAQWGADTELEACITWLDEMQLAGSGDIEVLRADRRPKPPSLKEQAQRILVENYVNLDGRMELDYDEITTIAHALRLIND
jgi:hypothetical protein